VALESVEWLAVPSEQSCGSITGWLYFQNRAVGSRAGRVVGAGVGDELTAESHVKNLFPRRSKNSSSKGAERP
jgi:hypothetical protein